MSQPLLRFAPGDVTKGLTIDNSSLFFVLVNFLLEEKKQLDEFQVFAYKK